MKKVRRGPFHTSGMKCPRCGRDIPQASPTCLACGQAVIWPAPVVIVQQKSVFGPVVWALLFVFVILPCVVGVLMGGCGLLTCGAIATSAKQDLAKQGAAKADKMKAAATDFNGSVSQFYGRRDLAEKVVEIRGVLDSDNSVTQRLMEGDKYLMIGWATETPSERLDGQTVTVKGRLTTYDSLADAILIP